MSSVSVQGMDVAEDQRLQALEQLGVLGTPPEERFDRITRVAQHLFGVDSVLISLISQDRQWLKSAQGTDVTSFPREHAFCDHTIRDGGTLVVTDASTDPRFWTNPHVLGEPGVRFYAGHSLEAPGGQRVGTLCLLGGQPREFSARERVQLELLAKWAQDELLSTAELDRAAEVQRGLQPHATTMVIPGYDLAGVGLAARVVGGDFLDWYATQDGDIAVTLGDVMGKGMGAAIMMATVRTVMRTVGLMHRPGVTLYEAAAAVEDDLQKTGTLVTVSHLRVTPATGAIAISDAGHGLCLIVRADGSVLRPGARGLPLGVVPDGEWAEHHDVLGPGDCVVSFSDGLLDLYDDTVETVFDEVVRVVRTSPDARTVVDHFARLARRHHLPDDVTLFAFRRLSEPPTVEELQCAVRPECLDDVHDLLTRLWAAAPDVADLDRMMVETAVIEIAGNIVEHAPGGWPIELTLRVAVHLDRIEARFHDDGRPADINLGATTLPDDPLAEHGRGLSLARAAGELDYCRRDGVNIWRLTRRRERR